MNAKIIYGTAWKAERTTQLVVQAVLQGFRAIDTAGQRKHYREDLVGEALQIVRDKHNIKREDLFLQTKFTPLSGQDLSGPLPYDPSSSISDSIRTSFATSLAHLHTSYLDSYLLHSPLDSAARTLQAWRVLSALRAEGKVRTIGISNCYDVEQLRALEAEGKVEVVQNRWFVGNNWDKDVRRYCADKGIQYQSFWTLTGSPKLLTHPSLRAIASTSGLTEAQVLYMIAQSLGITPLSGATNETHMREDLAVEEYQLMDGSLDEHCEMIRRIVA
ncbi:hypothetical protein PLICRDRAFT_37384 [Plicaturopsis crispa FD-325 SS-3]|nr:hypothetical protein PLICRDRAFT_37384 [Plicaturopsis crispa FD-325 SS-3]